MLYRYHRLMISIVKVDKENIRILVIVCHVNQVVRKNVVGVTVNEQSERTFFGVALWPPCVSKELFR
jgi:hypothetical protein